jgi:hypothetical protein
MRRLIVMMVVLPFFMIFFIAGIIINFASNADAQVMSSINKSNPSSGDILCRNYSDGYSIRYPSDWKSVSPTCTIFGPKLNDLNDEGVPTYIRISVNPLPGNSSVPSYSLSDLYNDVRYFTPANVFKLVQGPGSYDLNKVKAFTMEYDSNVTNQLTGLPYVNQSNMFSQSPGFPPFPSTSLDSSISSSSQQQTSNNSTNHSNNQKSPNLAKAIPVYLAKTIAIYAVKNNNAYVIEYTAPTDTFSTSLPGAIRAINSFSFLR